jgi:phage terminase small subunit
MGIRIEVPLPPGATDPRSGHIAPPWVPVTPRWEYKEVVRDLEVEQLLTPSDLDALGSDGWELSGVANEASRAHFYFKRERTR